VPALHLDERPALRRVPGGGKRRHCSASWLSAPASSVSKNECPSASAASLPNSSSAGSDHFEIVPWPSVRRNQPPMICLSSASSGSADVSGCGMNGGVTSVGVLGAGEAPGGVLAAGKAPGGVLGAGEAPGGVVGVGKSMRHGAGEALAP
jgi:hypothetical protein